MQKIQSTGDVGLPAEGATITPISAQPNYANYVAQIEANKGPEINAFGDRSTQGLDAGFVSQLSQSQGIINNKNINIKNPKATPFAADTAANVGPPNNSAQFNFYRGSPERQRLSNIYRYVANYNNITPENLARGVSGSELLASSPIVDGNNYFSDYVKGVPAVGAPSNATSTSIPIQSSPILGASSQSTGNFLDNTPSPQGFSMGGLITSDQTPPMPMLGNYATGGMVGQPPVGMAPPSAPPQAGLSPPMTAQGAQSQTPQQPQPPANPQMFDSNAADLLNQHPEVKQQIQKAVQQALASGQLTMQEAQLGVQLAQACINNPALWPQLRAFAIQNGLATDAQIPQQYDQGLVMAILIAAKAVQDPNNGGGAKGRYATGGMITGPGNGTSDSIPATTDTGNSIKVSNGEFIIPKHVVMAKGTDFFNKMIESYNQDGSTATTK